MSWLFMVKIREKIKILNFLDPHLFWREFPFSFPPFPLLFLPVDSSPSFNQIQQLYPSLLHREKERKREREREREKERKREREKERKREREKERKREREKERKREREKERKREREKERKREREKERIPRGGVQTKHNFVLNRMGF